MSARALGGRTRCTNRDGGSSMHEDYALTSVAATNCIYAPALSNA
jgi:hypothetical protein